MSNPDTTLPVRIKCARNHAGLSAEGLRILVGAGKGMAQKWELPESNSSHRKASPADLHAISAYCGTRLPWLEAERGPMEDPNRAVMAERIGTIIQNLGGADRVAKKAKTDSKDLKRWMRVGPANIQEASELKRALIAAGATEQSIHDATMGTGTFLADSSSALTTLKTEAHQTRTPHTRKGQEEWVSIPVYTARAAAGPAYQNGHDEISSEIRLSREHIRQVLRVPPEALAILHVEGDSMTPTLHPGDAIFIDTRPQEAPTDGIYLLRQDDALLVKQLQRLPGGVLQVSSRNPSYSPYTITPDNHEGFEVLGRVVGKCGRI